MVISTTPLGIAGGKSNVFLAGTTGDLGFSFGRLLLRVASTSGLAAHIRADRTICVYRLGVGSTPLRVAETVRNQINNYVRQFTIVGFKPRLAINPLITQKSRL